MKAMSDYLTEQKTISFAYDATLRSSPRITKRSRWRAPGQPITLDPRQDPGDSRRWLFQCRTAVRRQDVLTVLDKTPTPTPSPVPGTIDHLIEELKHKYHKPLPARTYC